MEQQLRRYFLGAVAFAFVVAWVTLGVTDAIVAALACSVAANLHRLLPQLGRSRRPSRPARRERRSELSVRSLRSEDDRPYQLVPDEPSLIIAGSP
ncbi:MAG: hypothetical protein V7644_1371 [Actinomycetota bacterium]|jgi:Flp pilus assembly protein TadB